MRQLSGKFSRRPSITDPSNKTFHKVSARLSMRGQHQTSILVLLPCLQGLATAPSDSTC